MKGLDFLAVHLSHRPGFRPVQEYGQDELLVTVAKNENVGRSFGTVKSTSTCDCVFSVLRGLALLRRTSVKRTFHTNHCYVSLLLHAALCIAIRPSEYSVPASNSTT